MLANRSLDIQIELHHYLGERIVKRLSREHSTTECMFMAP